MGSLVVSSIQGVARAASLPHRLDSDMGHNPEHAAKAFTEYLITRVADSYAPHLSIAFRNAHWELHEKALKGTSEQRPRWKVVLEATESGFGEALGRLYVSNFFQPTSKTKALQIVELVRDVLRERLEVVDWMSNDTREEALRKMDKFRVKIGYPDKWEYDYKEIICSENKFFDNLISVRRYAFDKDLMRINAATDRDRWLMTPQTINAYYHPMLNEIVFPAAILQAPFFDPDADDGANFGSMGAVIGHEMTHGFDDAGRKYDSNGVMRDWWSEADAKEYERRAAVVQNQAESFEVHGMKLQGKLTCGENIADLGGLKLAYAALERALEGVEDKPVNGYTARQRFFLSWASAWRENAKKERQIQLVTVDPHGPNEYRGNAPLTNMEAFFDAFDIKEGDEMFRKIQDRVNIW
jgi:putative endopeptidase